MVHDGGIVRLAIGAVAVTAVVDDDDVQLPPLPGHTAGQMGLHIDRADARALFCGDAIHSPVQILLPDASTASCADPARAARTRRALLEEAAATGRIVVPAHFRGARRVAVAARGAGFDPLPCA